MPLLGLLLLVAGACLVPMAETDLFFRIRVGEEILRTHALPRRNLFSFTFPDHPDPDPAWLFDVAVAALHRLGGFPAVVIGKTVVVVAVFAAAYQLCRRRGAGAVASAVALAAAALVMRERLVERPHIFSLAGEVAVLWALAAPRRVWWLVPATALWANLHAGAFLAPVLLLLAGLGALIDSRKQPEWRLFLAAAACLPALLLTPVGPGIFRYLTFHVGIFAVHPVDEFRSTTWVSDAPLVVFALAAVGAALVARPRARELLPAIGLGLLAARSARFGADFALVSAPIVAVGLTRALPRLAGRPATVVATVAVGALAVAPRIGQGFSISLDERELPLQAIRFVTDNGLRERMYNDFEIGAYLLWEGWPRYRVFVDPRLPAYPLSFHRLLGDPHLDRAAWDAALDGFGVTSALVAYAGINHRIGLWDPARWALVYRAHDARVFVRRLPRWQAFIAAHEIPATFTFTVENGAATVPLARPDGSPVPACEWQRRLGDLLFELEGQASAMAAYQRALASPGCLAPADEQAAAAWVGAVLLQRGQAAQALPFLERATNDLPSLTNRALALEAVGRKSEAAELWATIAARARGTPLGEKAAERARAPTR
jgi:tetratricopeptide (TPR) repeat protein